MSLLRTIPSLHPLPHLKPPSLTFPSLRMSSSKPAVATITSLDHLVLTVASIPRTISWYEKNLGMRHEAFVSSATPDITRHSLTFGRQKINLHEAGKEFSPKARNAKAGSADLCFLTEDKIEDVRNRLIEEGVEMVRLEGGERDKEVVERTGARGKLRSVYCRDEDGNLIEISNYV